MLQDKLNPNERANMSDADYNMYRAVLIRSRLKALSEDLVQCMAGEIVPDLDARKAEFVALHSELRVLEGKEPRKIAVDEGGETV